MEDLMKDLREQMKAFTLDLQIICGNPECKADTHTITVSGHEVASQVDRLISAFGYQADLLGGGNQLVSEMYMAVMFIATHVLKTKYKNFDDMVNWTNELAKKWDEIDKEFSRRRLAQGTATAAEA